MKFSSVLVLALAGPTSAFVTPSFMKSTHSAFRMADTNTEKDTDIETKLETSAENLEKKLETSAETSGTKLETSIETSEIVDKDVAPTIPTPPERSQALPWLDRPAVLDGTLAGDVGFDPLGFAKTTGDLMKYREAEIKHARLAMLAAAGWPISELLDDKIAKFFGATPALVGDRAPSILNGGLGKISPLYWVACLAAAAAIDLYGIKVASKKPGYTPGNLGFDPLGVYPKDTEGKRWFELAEIKNGRLAMIAITAFAFQELATQQGVVNETPLFFKPLDETLREYANSGYVQ